MWAELATPTKDMGKLNKDMVRVLWDRIEYGKGETVDSEKGKSGIRAEDPSPRRWSILDLGTRLAHRTLT